MTDEQFAHLLRSIEGFKQATTAYTTFTAAASTGEETQRTTGTVETGAPSQIAASTNTNPAAESMTVKERLYREYEDSMIKAFKHMNYLSKHGIAYADVTTRGPLQESGIESCIKEYMLDHNTTLEAALQWKGFKVYDRTTIAGVSTGQRRIGQHHRGQGRGKGGAQEVQNTAKAGSAGSTGSVSATEGNGHGQAGSGPAWKTATSWRAGKPSA
jgi:hypothetical protein